MLKRFLFILLVCCSALLTSAQERRGSGTSAGANSITNGGTITGDLRVTGTLSSGSFTNQGAANIGAALNSSGVSNNASYYQFNNGGNNWTLIDTNGGFYGKQVNGALYGFGSNQFYFSQTNGSALMYSNGALSASSFTGNGAGLTSLPAAQLVGALPTNIQASVINIPNGLALKNGTGTTMASVDTNGNITAATVNATSGYSFFDSLFPNKIYMQSSKSIHISSNSAIGWHSSVDATTGSFDLALFRNSVGILEINTGVPGQFGSLKISNIISSGSVTINNNTADATAAMTVNQQNAGSTGPIINYQSQGVTKASVNNAGGFSMGSLTQQGTTTTDVPAYGAELLSAAGWTSTGWTGSWASGWQHSAGNTNILTNTLNASIGVRYQISYTVTGVTAGSVTLNFGGQTISFSASGAFGPSGTTTAALAIIPTSNFDGTIALSIKQITGVSAPICVLKSSDGTARFELRSPFASANTFAGVSAGSYNTTGTNNTASGVFTLYANTTGYNNTASGVESLTTSTTGYNNTASGYRVLFLNTTGCANTASGAFTLYANTTGSNNTASGYSALYGNTTGYNNLAIGWNPSYVNTIGHDNVAVGNLSLYASTGSYNTANGNAALYSGTANYCNTASGYSSGRSITTGTSNSFIGYYSGYNASQKVDAINSTAIGAGAYTTADNQMVFGDTNVTQTVLRGAVVASSSPVPATATSSGVAGSIAWDANFIYVCVAANSWKRAAISSW